jgi:hypothetical protein
MHRRGDLADAGMQAILDSYAGPGSGSQVAVPGGAAGVSISADFALQIGRLATALEARNRWEQELADACHPFDLPVSNMNLTTNLEDNAIKWAPRDGYAWDIKNLVAAGFTAGTVTVYKASFGQAVAANQRFTFTSAGVWQMGTAQLLLLPGQRLTFTASGITGAVVLSGDGIQIKLPYLAAYLM